jgi:hypothetical protein
MKIKPRTIFFDDERMFRKGFERDLISQGIQVDAFGTPHEAADALRKRRYDAGIFDIHDEDGASIGFELANSFLRTNSNGLAYLITGWPDIQETPGTLLLTKPIRKVERIQICNRIKEKFQEIHSIFEFALPIKVVGVIEQMDQDAFSVSFFHKKLGWMIVRLPIVHLDRENVVVGDKIDLGLALDGKRRVQGFQMQVGRPVRKVAESKSELGETFRALPNIDVTNADEVEGYRKLLKSFFQGKGL